MDSRFRFAVITGGALLVVVITYVRFCGSLSLPPKPPPPTGPTGTEQQLLAQSIGSPAVYKSFLEHDASTAGVRVPSIEDMSRKLSYRVDEARHPLEPGQPPVDVAGLRLHVERSRDAVVLVIQNTVDAPLGYNVVTSPSIGSASCDSIRPLPFNANVIAVELLPLQVWYLNQVPPSLLNIDPRVARGHRGGDAGSQCSTVVSAVIHGLEDRGEITWRDLADFYARHRCQSYQFPSGYRAFKTDGERALPAADNGS
jgi:hypothetical protein